MSTHTDRLKALRNSPVAIGAGFAAALIAQAPESQAKDGDLKFEMATTEEPGASNVSVNVGLYGPNAGAFKDGPENGVQSLSVTYKSSTDGKVYVSTYSRGAGGQDVRFQCLDVDAGSISCSPSEAAAAKRVIAEAVQRVGKTAAAKAAGIADDMAVAHRFLMQ